MGYNRSMESDPTPFIEVEPEPRPQPDPPQAPRRDAGAITFKRSHLYSVLLPLAFVAGLGVGYLFWGRAPAAAAPSTAASAASGESQSSAASGASGANTASQGSEKPTRYNVPDDGDPSLGPK